MWELAIPAVASLFSGFIGGSNNEAKADTNPMVNASGDYLNYAKNMYGNPNSDFYKRVKKGQYNTLFDMMMMNNRQKYNQLIAQGYNPSAKLMNDWQKASEANATESADNFASSLYANGMNNVNDAYKTNVSTIGQATQIQAGVNSQNAQSKDAMWSGLAGLGSNLLGQFYQGQNSTSPTISLDDLKKLISSN